MEFDFSLGSIFPNSIMMVGKDISPRVVDGSLNTSSPGSDFYKKSKCVDLDPSGRMGLGEVIDTMGARSAQAQHLQQAVTNTNKLRCSDNHVIYIMTQCVSIESSGDDETGAKGICIGFLKVGRRQLYVNEEHDKSHQRAVVPVCLLDFYVHESVQRKGYGKQLYDAMLKNEHARVEHVAIDRPSSHLTEFLSKHYSLCQPRTQLNNFVVYPGFFDNRQEDSHFVPETGSNTNSNNNKTTAKSSNGNNGAADHHDSHKNGSNGNNANASETVDSPAAAGTVTSNVNMRNLHDHHRLW